VLGCESVFGTDWRNDVVSRVDAATGRGWLAHELIQGSVRARFGAFRECYEAALVRDRDLRGRVAVKFKIDREGRASRVQDGGSDLPDADVVACVVQGFTALRFPKPEQGVVTVVYPIIFKPGD
jgi:hypothetical protein